MSRFTTVLAGATLALAALTGTASAQQFPDKPIQLMVAFPAGGSTDVAARIVAAIAEKALGQSIVVVNKGGAGGQIGWTELVRQKPDGYYIGFHQLARNQHGYPRSRAKGHLHREGFHADYQSGSGSWRDLG